MRTLDRIIWRNRIGSPAWSLVGCLTGSAIGTFIRGDRAWSLIFACGAIAFLIVSLISKWMKPPSGYSSNRKEPK